MVKSYVYNKLITKYLLNFPSIAADRSETSQLEPADIAAMIARDAIAKEPIRTSNLLLASFRP